MFKILHLPTATYMYYNPLVSSPGKALISQYEFISKRYGSSMNLINLFFSKECAMECLLYWYNELRETNTTGNDAFMFSNDDVSEKPENRAYNFILEHFDIVEVDDA